jgi:iron(III) transport system substrate-binding protein
VRVERSGAERNFQRIGHEQGSRIYAVDICTIAPAHFIHWIQNDWVAPFVPEGVARHFPSEHVDPNGMHAVLCAWLETIGYNTKLVGGADAPKRYSDLA